MNTQLDDISIRHLQYALHIRETGSVSAAATRLRIAQPSLSQQLRKLEERLGARIFERKPSGLEPTAAGNAFLDHVGKALQDMEDAALLFSGRHRRARAGVAGGLNANLVATLRSIACSENLFTEMKASVAATAVSVTMLLRGDLDFALGRLPVDHPDLVSATVASEELGVVVGPHNPLAQRSAVGWGDLESMKLLWFSPERAPEFSAEVLNHLSSCGWNPEREYGPPSRALFHWSLLTDKGLVALRPRYAVTHDGALRWIALLDRAPQERVGVVARRGSDAASAIAHHGQCLRVIDEGRRSDIDLARNALGHGAT